MNNLFLFTDMFPYGPGEKTFVEPELNYLLQRYDITIISCAADEYRQMTDCVSPLPNNVNVIHWRRPSKLLRSIVMISFPFSSVGRLELKDIAKDGLTMGRVFESAKEYSIAKLFQWFCRSIGVFNSVDQAIYYSFWFGFQNLAVAFEKHLGRNVLVISRAHGYDVFNERRVGERQPFQRFKLNKCNALYFASECALHYFDERFITSDNTCNCEVNRLGVAEGGLNPDKRDAVRHLVSCSNVIPLKRVDLICQAVNLLQRDGFRVRWTHFGTGVQLDEVRSHAREYNIDADFPGGVANSQILEYYANVHVDVFVHVSSSEGGCPVAIQEALSFGIPVIGANVGGVPETIDGNGVLIKSDPTSSDIAEAIKKVAYADSAEDKAMRSRSLQLWRDRFNVESNKKEFINSILHIEETFTSENDSV